VPINLTESASDHSPSAGAYSPAADRPATPLAIGLAVAAAVVVSLVAISGRSLWIDEAATAVQAMHPTLSAWWQQLVQEKTAHLQMPLYMLCIWGYEKLFGASEWALRLANLPCFVAGAGLFILSFRAGERRWPIAAWVVLFCPFAWYYLDEARPYAMLLGSSLVVVASLRFLAQRNPIADAPATGQVALFLFGLLVLCGSSLLGMIWAAGALAALPVLLSQSQFAALLKQHRGLWLTAGVLLLAAAVYYLWTLKVGARATAPTISSWGSVLFVGYEVLGFGGLGPGRLELRSAGPAALHGYWIGVALYGAVSASLIGAAILHELKLRNRQQLMLALCAGVPAVFILGAGWMAHFRVLGRHFAPFVPVCLLIFATGLSELWARRSLWARFPVVLFCSLSLLSCLSLRFASRHERDNYRAAAAVAKTALSNGEQVWWSAAGEGARYYGVPISESVSRRGEALLVANQARDALDKLPVPRLIIASKSDLYDVKMALAEYLRDQGYSPTEEFAAFVVWERKRN